MSESSLAQKLKLMTGLKAAVVNPPENYLDSLQHDAELSTALRGKFDWIQIFVKNKAELDLNWVTLVSVDETWSAFGMRPYREGDEKQSFRLGN